MFGKGGGALSAWIKEFCQLVFIQAIQAFIYATVITVIMALYVNAAHVSSSDTTTDYTSGLGLFAIVALVSVFKVEDIIRKLFGFGPTKADHGNAIKSIAKTAFALKLGSRVLDNAKKVGGGVKSIIDSNKDAKKAKNRLDRRMEAFNKDNAGGGVSATSTADNNGTSQRMIDSEKRDEKLKLFADAQKARKMAQTETDPNKKKALIEEAKRKLAASRAIDDTLHETNSSGGSSSKSSGKSGNYHQTLLNLQEQYEKELSDAKKKRSEGIKTMTKGIVETGGAVIGATGGAILGFADGNLDEGIQGAMSGAGLGDAAGSFATDVSFGTADALSKAATSTRKALKDYSTNIAEQYETEKKAAVAGMKDLDTKSREAVKRINKNVEKASADLEKEIELSAGQKAKAMAKAVGKGSNKAYKSRHSNGIKELSSSIKDLENHINNVNKSTSLPNNVESID